MPRIAVFTKAHAFDAVHLRLSVGPAHIPFPLLLLLARRRVHRSYIERTADLLTVIGNFKPTASLSPLRIAFIAFDEAVLEITSAPIPTPATVVVPALVVPRPYPQPRGLPSSRPWHATRTLILARTDSEDVDKNGTEADLAPLFDLASGAPPSSTAPTSKRSSRTSRHSRL
ncbi:hypothetical protein R3P38DRAFT_3168261 [Favolaschia claudopus]|uniref:Uncharacterized protein n=1 Tax=Favolaschia claudopus TaxID=2862362 RepID=A0AAW0E6D4_9AGAR